MLFNFLLLLFYRNGGSKCYLCTYEKKNAYLYPLEKGLILIYKDPIYIPFSDIITTKFMESQKWFEIEITCKNEVIYLFERIDQ